MVRTRVSVDVLERAVADVPDPEVPVVTIEDLGILRSVQADEATGRVRVTITPTYSGCPAMGAIERGIVHAAAECGWAAEVVTVLSPPWTTDWVSERGREAMRRFGIAPPGPTGPARPAGPVTVTIGRHEVACPLCGSVDTEELSRFGSTACKALRRCRSCREPFEEFKAL
jgi:ring-1,2-phenylacetyl-CoA epoxidase subunit PaaD